MTNNLNKLIYVTQPSMPPLDEFVEYLKEIWDSKWLTNNGKFHNELEKALCKYLGVDYLSLFSNGTLALITALQTLKITGEVITTPFSFVATTHALWWNGIKPVFVDIEPDYLNIDPKKIEAAITPQTTAILPVHVYGNPCNVNEIQNITDTYGLKLIYDSAHTFGANLNSISLCSFGDLSILSFHATKVFNTFEGGAIICHDAKTKARIDFLKNFGIANETTVVAPGINAKMNEIQAAFGLLNLKYVSNSIEKRKKIAQYYRQNLCDINGINLLKEYPGLQSNYSYFPILIDAERYSASRDEVYEMFKSYNIFSRRYFYPLISEFPTYRCLPSSHLGNLPVASRITKEVLCLPIYPDLGMDTVKLICNLLKNIKWEYKHLFIAEKSLV